MVVKARLRTRKLAGMISTPENGIMISDAILEHIDLDLDKIFGESKELDFVYVDDVVDALLKSLDEYDNVKNHSYNIASGKGTKLKILADVLKSITNSEIDINTHDNRKGEIMKFVADINKSEKYLGYSPKVDLERGLALTASWYKKQIKGRD